MQGLQQNQNLKRPWTLSRGRMRMHSSICTNGQRNPGQKPISMRIITKNNYESLNAKILNYRSNPILTLLEEIKCYIMWKMSSNKLKMVARMRPLAHMQQSCLEKEKRESNKGIA